jgi:DNA-binding winged helix-turn-helix (wHTH) protein/TolB-like protein/Tfp pilus assembly protein PilF
VSAPTSADARARPRLTIGEWSVDPDTNTLRRRDEVVRIEPKAMDVLVLLAAEPGRVVRRDELLGAVWPGVVVGDESLTQSIIKLRRALGDNPRAPVYIETISKRGYRLVAPTRPDDASPPDAVPDDAPGAASATALAVHADARGPARSAGRRRLARLSVPVAAALIVLAAVGLQYFGALAPSPTTLDASTRADDGSVASSGAGRDETAPQAWVTVAVAPFDAVGADPEQAYLARGIGDDVTTALSGLSDLRVIRESSVHAGAIVPPARYRISGSVQRRDDRLRIDVHMADTRTGEELWSGRFERPFGDLFAVQEEMTARLAALLPAKVGDIERQRLAKRYTRSLDAYDHFLRAQSLFLVRGREQNEQARALYRSAIDLDPEFARAYAGLAMTYAMESRLGDSPGVTASLDRAFELAETARQIDPDLPEVYWALGFVHAQSRRHAQAIEALQQAIERNRSFADAYALLGGIHTYEGRAAASIPLLRTAMRLNPDGGYLYFLLLGRAYLFENDIEQALINLRAASMRNPVDIETRIYLAAALAASGDAVAAGWEADEIRSLQPGFSVSRWLHTYPATAAPQIERLAALLAGAGL